MKKLNPPFDALKITLKGHRDELVDVALLEVHGMTHGMEISVTYIFISPSEKHSLVDELEEWRKQVRSDWKLRTEKLNRRAISLFIDRLRNCISKPWRT